jgi:autotransporter translocation and assembly factor TamB
MEFKNLNLETDNSKIIGDILLNYGENGMADFINNVQIIANFKGTQLATNDLNSFYNEFGPDQLININGEFNGTINNFAFTNTDITSGDTRISGNFTVKGILSEENYYSIDAENHSITTSYYELRRFMPKVLGEVVPVELKDAGKFTLTGNTSITTTDLITKSTFTSGLGNAEIDFSMGNINNFDNAYYKGNLVLKRFNLGKIAGTTSLGNTTANLNFDGRGFTQQTINTQIKGTISSFNFEGYNYQKINVAGNLKNPLFNGELSIDDPNLKLSFKGLIDVSKDFNQYDFEADVEYAELNKLKLVTRDSVSIFAGKVTAPPSTMHMVP